MKATVLYGLATDYERKPTLWPSFGFGPATWAFCAGPSQDGEKLFLTMPQFTLKDLRDMM